MGWASPSPSASPNHLDRRIASSASELSKESHGPHGEAVGTATLYVDDTAVAESERKTQPGHFALCGEGLTVGRDSSDPGTKEYGAPLAFTGGRIKEVEINIGDDGFSTWSATSRPRCRATEVARRLPQ